MFYLGEAPLVRDRDSGTFELYPKDRTTTKKQFKQRFLPAVFPPDGSPNVHLLEYNRNIHHISSLP